MNIKEIEERSGLTRANIRYYEQEGLIAPVRRENKYRDYSEEDLETLLRIALLRNLGFSLDEIRRLQSGELELAAAMRERSAALESEGQRLLAARNVCGVVTLPVQSTSRLWDSWSHLCSMCCCTATTQPFPGGRTSSAL